jgi:hypothetical protein
MYEATLKSLIFLNPQLKGNMKSAHYIVYFDAGEDDFAKPYDEISVKEY